MTSAGREILLAEIKKSAAAREAPATDTLVSMDAEVAARLRARRLALLLMAASSLFVLVALGAIWWLT